MDIDGVLETTPSWKKVELEPDGFMKLNKSCLENLATFHSLTNASVVLTTTHRINYTEAQWKEIFKARGLVFDSISKLNNKTAINQLLEKELKFKNGQKLLEQVKIISLLMMTFHSIKCLVP